MPDRTWPALEIGRLKPAPEGDVVSAALLDYSVAAIEETAADAWRVFFATKTDRDSAARDLARQFPELSMQPVDVPDEDWAAKSQATLKSVQIGGVIVAPPWDIPHTGRLKPVAFGTRVDKPIVIVIQPSMGFGTAHHATTRLCLMALQQLELENTGVLDIGSGSGVLAIAASRLGAPRVVGIDDDANAIHAMTENLHLNRGASVVVREGDFRSASLDPADVIVANLTGALLKEAASRIASLMLPGGRMILSGFTRDEETSVLGAYSGATVTSRTDEGEWVCVSLNRNV